MSKKGTPFVVSQEALCGRGRWKIYVDFMQVLRQMKRRKRQGNKN